MNRWLERPVEVVRIGEGAVVVAIVVLLVPSSAARSAVMVLAGAVTAIVASLLAFNLGGFLGRYRAEVSDRGYSGAFAHFPSSTWRAAGLSALIVGVTIFVVGVAEL